MPTPLAPPAADRPSAPAARRRVVLSLGMGVESVAILVRWLLDPASRDFALEDLVVLVAMVGSEFADTRRLMERYLLPLLRQHGVRFVQVARTGRYERDDIVVLDDSRAPTVLHMDGAFRLWDELLTNGTIPQMAGVRKCSQKYKGFPLDTWLEREFQGAPFEHVIGFNACEDRRIAKDLKNYVNGRVTNRQPSFPLKVWGWDRARCEAYLAAAFGEPWTKSCCSFCPFTQGRPEALARYVAEPEAAADALFLEHVALALNPRQALYKTKSLRFLLARGDAGGNDGPHAPAMAAFAARLAAAPWAVYHVRRVWDVRAKPGQAKFQVTYARSVAAVTHGDRAACVADLEARAAALDAPVVEEAGSPRALVRVTPAEAIKSAPGLYGEEFYVVAPAVVEDKAPLRFERLWQGVLAGGVGAQMELGLGETLPAFVLEPVDEPADDAPAAIDADDPGPALDPEPADALDVAA